MNIVSYSNLRTRRSAVSANTSIRKRQRRFCSASRAPAPMSARTDAGLWGTAGWRRQLRLTELYELSMPLLSEIELVGQRLPDDKSREGNLSSAFANRSVAISSELAALEIPVSGHRDSAADSLLVEPARDAKSDPILEPDAAPARSLQPLPTALTPQVRELPPPSVPLGPPLVAAVLDTY